LPLLVQRNVAGSIFVRLIHYFVIIIIIVIKLHFLAAVMMPVQPHAMFLTLFTFSAQTTLTISFATIELCIVGLFMLQ